jgi:hypothetical protein
MTPEAPSMRSRSWKNHPLICAITLLVLGCGTNSNIPDKHSPEADSSPTLEPTDSTEPTEPTEPGEASAFPGAEGFGTDTPGGRGGRVIIVDTLAPDGPGSLTEALLETGPRIIVFRVSGVFDFAGAVLELGEAQSFVTVAGQSSPGGITLKNVTLSAYHSGFHDAVFRFLRLRGPDTYDNLSFATVHHIVIDHCDFSGGSDEALDITSGQDITVQWSTITNSRSDEGSQSYGLLLAYKPTTRITLHHNLSAHHGGRCGAELHWVDDEEPDPADGAWLDFRNNILYNCGFQQLLRSDQEPATGAFFNLVGNLGKSGPQTLADSMMFGVGGSVYLEDNDYEGQSLIMSPWFEGEYADTPFDFAPVTTTSRDTAYEEVLAWAGAWPRDPMNLRTIGEVQDGTGSLGRQDDALIEDGPAAPADGDEDGMPDEWETAQGLDPSDPSDALALTTSGYTQIELYLADRAAALIGQ